MTTDVQEAERDVERSKQRLQESLRVVGETGNRLATEVSQKAGPALVAAVVVGAAATGLAIAISRSRSRSRWGAPKGPSFARDLAHAAGAWLVRTLALKLAAEMAARLREPEHSGPAPAQPA